MVWLLLVSFAVAQEEANLGLAQIANKPRHSPAFVSFASSSYGMLEPEEAPTYFLRSSPTRSSRNVNIAASSDFGDLHQFDVFFNEVRAKKYLRPNSIEVMKQHVFHSSPGVNTPASGWRMEAFVDDWRIGFGDEVVATRPLDAAGLEPIHSKRLREFLYGMKTTTYGAAGLRLNDFESGFSFEGLGSILGRTYVDQTMTTLQSAPSWHSVPWRKVPSGVSRRS